MIRNNLNFGNKIMNFDKNNKVRKGVFLEFFKKSALRRGGILRKILGRSFLKGGTLRGVSLVIHPDNSKNYLENR